MAHGWLLSSFADSQISEVNYAVICAILEPVADTPLGGQRR